MCNSIILKLEDISSIKRYFEFILSQTEKGEKFPIKLDDVFALVYSRKDKAVRALIDSDQFMQDIDYKVFPLNGGNSNGGRPSVEVADVEEVVLIEEQTRRIQLIRNM